MLLIEGDLAESTYSSYLRIHVHDSVTASSFRFDLRRFQLQLGAWVLFSFEELRMRTLDSLDSDEEILRLRS
ncbi:hypothetical protein AAHA92_01447 [Salvia divinorum]|uniref:Uncharacterized protein n=1 Tax=Salvia divinorum TaxID=28513 RepID=A0ABD1IBI0_SALDI